MAVAERISGFVARVVATLFGSTGRRDLLELCGEDPRIVEIGPRDAALARHLDRHGRSRYLGLAEPARVEELREASASPRLADRFVAQGEAGELPRVTADVAMVTGRPRRPYWSFLDLAGLGRILWRPRCDPRALPALAGLVVQAMLGLVRVEGAVRVRPDGGHARWYVAFRVRQGSQGAVRRLSPVIGVERFFRRLEKRGVRYSVLRWPELLPDPPPDRDIDLLVHDDGLDAVEAMFAEEPGTIAFDVYSTSGRRGTDWRHMAYFPPPLARRMLERTRRTEHGIRIPSPRDRFHSVAFHVVYHKGDAAGLPRSRGEAPRATPKHDYAGRLARLAAEAGEDVELTLEALDAHLGKVGWRPPPDMLERLAEYTPWLETRLPALAHADPGEWKGLAVFFVRERGHERGLAREVVERFARAGFTILRRRALSPDERRRVRARIRGGNWEQGPWPAPGGGPAYIIVAYDLLPLPPDPEQRSERPTLDNARLLVKHAVRDALNARYPVSERCNLIHSSDHSREALVYLRTTMPGEVGAIRAEIERLRAAFSPDPDAVRRLPAQGHRARVVVVEAGDRRVVRKTFLPGFERMAERERFVMEELGRDRPEIPRLLDAGEDYTVRPYYPNAVQAGGRGLMPLEAVHRILDAIRFFHGSGYALVDFAPDNVLVLRDGGIRLIDFECLHEYAEPPARLEQAWELAGAPAGFAGDRRGWGDGRSGYDALWRPVVGLSLRSLLEDPPWVQRLKRQRYRARLAQARALDATATAGGRVASVSLRVGRRAVPRHYRQALRATQLARLLDPARR